jgi:hypothetical protein
MGNFLENILNSEVANSMIESAKEKLQDGKISETLGKVGIGSEKLSQMAKSVISVIGLAGKSFDKKPE